jgi:hypothetical protein
MKKLINAAITAGLLAVTVAPAFAADAPTTKADCKKAAGMKWDSKTNTCIKK